MVVERKFQLDDVLPEEITVSPELANGPFSSVLEEAFELIETQIQINPVADVEKTQQEWGKIILSWWKFNIRAGVVKAEYGGDETDGQWICTYSRNGEEAQLKIDVTNGFINSPRITARVLEENGDTNWEVVFNNDWIESIGQEIYREDPEGKLSGTKETVKLYHAVPQFRTKPSISTSESNL